MKFIKENFDKSVEIERKIARFLENKRMGSARHTNLSEGADVESIYQITYAVANGIFSSVMVKASSEEEARDKFSKKHKTKKIVGAKEISGDEADDMKKRGMSLMEELDKDTIEKLAKKYNLTLDDFGDEKVHVFGKDSDINAFSDEYDSLMKNENLTEEVDITVDGEEFTPEGEEEIKPSPETDAAMGIANTLNALIRDEWEAIDGYNSSISTYRAMQEDKETAGSIDFDALIKILEDIAQEEMNHVGMLQKAMETVSPNAEEIKGGEEEAEETLGETPKEEVTDIDVETSNEEETVEDNA